MNIESTLRTLDDIALALLVAISDECDWQGYVEARRFGTDRLTDDALHRLTEAGLVVRGDLPDDLVYVRSAHRPLARAEDDRRVREKVFVPLDNSGGS